MNADGWTTTLTLARPAWLAVAAALALLAFWLYRRRLARGRLALPLLRALAVFLVAALLAGPSIVRSRSEEKRGRVVLLRDESASMDAADVALPASRKVRVAAALGLAPVSAEALAAADAGQDDWLVENAPDVIATFDEATRAARASATLDSGLREAVAEAADLDERSFGTADATDVAPALAAVSPAPDAPTAVLLLTDARRTETDAAAVAEAARLGEAGVAVHTLLVGDAGPGGDVAVTAVRGPDAVDRGSVVTGEVDLVHGLPAGEPIALSAAADDGTPIWSTSIISAGPGPQTFAFEFLLTPAVTDAGRLLAVTLTATAEGDTNAANDAASFALRVESDETRVLIADARPRWDSRYAVAHLERERRFDADAALDVDSADTLDVGRIESADVVVLGDVPADALGDEAIDAIVDHVRDDGGGLIVVDGLRGNLAGWSATRLADVLPVDRGNDPARSGGPLRLTDAGRAYDALRLDPDANADLWQALPPPRWRFDATARPGVGEVLVEGDDGTPVVVAARIGRGRVIYVGTDETWRWRRGSENRVQAAFWTNLVADAAGPPTTAEDERLALTVETAAPEAGGRLPVAVRAKADDVGRVEVRLMREDELIATADLSPGAGGLLRGELPVPTVPGRYEVSASAVGESAADVRTDVVVLAPPASPELRRLDADLDFAGALAAASGGTVIREGDDADVAALFDGFTTRTTIERRTLLRSSWPPFAAAVGLLSIEWFARRRMGLS